MIAAWRLTKPRYAGNAFDGEGARLYGGRWNSVGTRVAYASESVALATLEVLAGLQDTGALSVYSLVGVEFPEELVVVLPRAALPAGWDRHPPTPETQRIGDLWAAQARSAVLQVPSAIVEAEFNFLLNPRHPGFASVRIHAPRPFRMDPRLLR